MENFWPNLNLNDTEGPIDIITVQGDLLEKHTNGVLTYKIEKKLFEHKSWPTGRAIRFDFYVRAPLFDDFKFLLFFIVHDFIAIYPLKIGYYTEEGSSKVCSNKTELEANLKEILSRSETASILQSMLIQSKKS